jgi:hypothetical protein
MNQQQIVSQLDSANKIFVFDEVYPFRAAQEQAEKKKLNAFGMMAKLNPLNRPKEQTVQLVRQELRFEPFWHIMATRSVDYTCQLTYQVPVHNPYAQSLHIVGNVFDVARQKDKARIEFVAQETCHRKLGFDRLMDGMQRDSVKPAQLAAYITKYKYTEVEVLERPEVLKPKLPLAGAIQVASAALTGEAINAFDIQADQIEFERTYMYVRPVFAFEFKWTSADKVGVIEVDGLTGEVVENGDWFKDKVKDIITRETLLDLGAEVAGSLIPGGGVAVKLIGKMAAPTPPQG